MLRWLQNHPRWLERAYQMTHTLFQVLDPLWRRLGYGRVDRWLRGGEEVSKRAIFDCRMCGQCILHSTGMTCPMTCPKNLRNGPCGGVRANGNCEVIPEMPCIWVEAVNRSRHMPQFGAEIGLIQPPLNHQLSGTSAWINALRDEDQLLPDGWIDPAGIPVLSEGSSWMKRSSQAAA